MAGFIGMSPLQGAVINSHTMVTLPPLAGLLHMLSPQHTTHCLLPAKADPHHFKLSPRQMETLMNSDMLIRTSRDDGQWKGLTHVKTIDVWPWAPRQHSHAWLNPARVLTVLEHLAPQLGDISKATLHSAKNKVIATDAAWKKAIVPLKSRGVIMQHPAWKGLFLSYDIPVLLVLESEHHDQEQGPHILEEGLRQLTEHPDAILIGDQRHSNRALEWLANHHHGNHPIVYLDALGACNTPWVTLMQHNLDRLAQSMQP